jgi:hypothetical protein
MMIMMDHECEMRTGESTNGEEEGKDIEKEEDQNMLHVYN